MSSFFATGSRHIAALQATATTYEHGTTGARHLHFATADRERAFLIAFPTLPDRSDGRAHVLEHLLLCGSRRYPLRDPFFAMMSRSLATFMNAMTYADQTVYPFATPNLNDYFNLMDVYLDATFFPRLDRLDFLQEAWRPVLKDGRLTLQGVVLNEMKGGVGDAGRALGHALNQTLMEGSVYAVDSGGDPLLIPQLAHAELAAFHAAHYHPTQAVFMSWGDVSAEDVQRRIEDRVLAAFAGHVDPLVAPPVPTWTGVRRVTIDVPATDAGGREHRLQMAWRLGRESDLDAAMQARLMESVLLAPGAGVLLQVIESAGFGRPSNHAGLDASTTETVLHVGMEGLAESDIERAHACIVTALERTARVGVIPELLAAGIRELRSSDRRTSSGVQRLIGLASAAVRRHDVLAVSDMDERLAKLQRVVADPAFVRRWIEALLSDSPTVVAHVRPDPAYVAGRDAAAAQWVSNWQARLTDSDRADIDAQNKALAAHQGAGRAGADCLLPRITPADVSREDQCTLTLDPPVWRDRALRVRTNGLSQALVKFDASAVAEADWPWLHLYAELLPQLGARGRDHVHAAAWRRARVATMHARCQVLGTPSGAARLEFTLSVDALREEQSAIAEVGAAWILAPDIADADRLRYLVGGHVESRLARLQEDAFTLAALEANARVSAAGRVENAVRGLPALDFLAQLRHQLTTADGIARIRASLQRVHARLLRSPRTLLCAGIEDDAQALLTRLQDSLGPSPCGAASSGGLIPPLPTCNPAASALYAPAQVNHCLALWRVPTIGHRDAPALAVLAELLQQQMLHPLVREQGGAYGVFAQYLHERGTFACVSRTDPRLAATFGDFKSSLSRLAAETFEAVALEQAILAVVRQTDRPLQGLPDLERAWFVASCGIGADVMVAHRRGVLDCTMDEVRRAAATHLTWARVHRAAAMGWREQDSDGLAVANLGELAARAGLVGALTADRS